MKNPIVTFALLWAFTSMNAQKINPAGALTPSMLRQIEQSQPSSSAEKALRNAAASNNIDDLAKNSSHQGAVDAYFSIETPRQNIQDQRSSGRCWMFSGLNVLRANFAKAHNDSMRVEFSQAYLFFYDQMEKANFMLQNVIDNAEKNIDDPRVQYFFKSPINDGGTFCGVADLADKYGLVPMSVMPETYSSDNTKVISRLISSKLREFGLELRRMVTARKKADAIIKRKTEMLGTIYNMLVMTMGEPVKTFTYTFCDKNGKPTGP